MSLLIDLKSRKLPISVGKKDLNLRRLHGFACDWKVYHLYIINDVSLVDELRLEPSRNLNPDKYYAVRSSGNIEDSFDRSFAGQFKSVLNVCGVDDILQALWSVWSSLQSHRDGVPVRIDLRFYCVLTCRAWAII